MRRTVQERLAPFDWGELKDATEFVQPYLTIGVFTEQTLKEYNDKLELLFPSGYYDDSYDHLPKWEAVRLPKQWWSHDEKRHETRTKRNGKFISKTKENK